jgi:glycosyltransferase involved in cell wall biosynthesis
MKVLHIVKTAVGAGWVYHQVRVLRSLGVEVVVALPSATEGLAPLYCETGATVTAADVDFPARQPWRLPAKLAACRKLVDSVRPDLIHTHHVGTTIVARLALGKRSPIPRIFQVPGTLHLEHEFFARLDMQLAGPQDYWIATCEWTRRKYEAMGVPSGHVFLSYAGTDVRAFSDARTGRLRAELGVPSEAPLVGMVAYMYAPKWFLGQERGLKGHEDFIAALRLVRDARPEVRGVIVGGPWGDAAWYDDQLRYRGTKTCNGYLAFLGPRRDVPALYPDLDVAVVPSLSENVGGAVEPLLSGVPVVSTNVGGLPDLVQEKKTGWLAPPHRPEALARAILEVLNDRDEAKRRTTEGQALARTLFDAETTGREVAAVYEQILGEPLLRATKYKPTARKQIRVLHTLGSFDPGGVETWLLNVLKYIDREQFHLDFCTFGPSPGLNAKEVEKLGGKILRCPKGANLWAFRNRFRQILREGHYDVVHSHVHLFSGALLRWAKAEGVPMRIAHSHTSRDDRSNTLLRGYYSGRMRSWIDQYATHGLAASRLAAQQLFGADWEADRRFRVLYYGIDLAPFQEPISREEVRAELGIPLDAPVVGHVGRFVAAKNHAFLVKIAGEILKMRPEVHFLLVGDGPLRRETEARARTEGIADRMHFAGSRTDVPRLMRGGMDVFLFPSIYEGFGLTLLEAQTAGLRCVVSDCVPNEIAVSNQFVDFLPLPRGATHWASHVIQLLGRPRPSLASMIETISQSQFAIRQSVRGLASIYKMREAPDAPLVVAQHA